VTDDGSVILYIAEDQTMQAITINWSNGQSSQETIQSEPIWRNVAISRDGSRLAALTDDYDERLWVYDFGLETWTTYFLYNPTTGEGIPTTDDVLYADVLEWDFTGEWVMYDALNRLNTTGSNDIEYWDISFIRVWDTPSNDFGDGYVGKLFNGLPENVSVGNPTFAKNSDYIIAFDYFDEFNEEYFMYGANIETGEANIIFENFDLSWPNYSVDDNRIVFDAQNTSGNPVLAFIPMEDDKITAAGNATIFINDGRKAVWFANGERVLTEAAEVFSENSLKTWPNPAGDWLNVFYAAEKSGEGKLEFFDLTGKLVFSENHFFTAGGNHLQIPLAKLSFGPYLLRLVALDGQSVSLKVVKK
jgi:hypothetical protein